MSDPQRYVERLRALADARGDAEDAAREARDGDSLVAYGDAVCNYEDAVEAITTHFQRAKIRAHAAVIEAAIEVARRVQGERPKIGMAVVDLRSVGRLKAALADLPTEEGGEG